MSRVVFLIALGLGGCLSSKPAAVTPAVAYPAQRPRTFEWQRPQAQVLPDGDLRWAPEPFSLELGKIVRYVDFQDGSDANDGTSRSTPWKHHPWDAAATGKAAAGSDADTFVFKLGATYRGVLVAAASGRSASEPIRLTADPAWGKGDAIIESAVPDPASAASRRLPTIVIRDQSNVSISGVTFRFPATAGARDMTPDDNLAAIRVVGNCRNIRVANCLFQRVPSALCATAGKLMDHISFTDNRVESVEREAIRISAQDGGTLGSVQVLRNSIHDAGQHPAGGQEGHSIAIVQPRFAEVAGNMLARTTGISVEGGASDADAMPPRRILIHHNKIIDSLWAVAGASGIQTSRSGAFYVYDNVVSPHDSAYAVNDSYKTYVYNNIGFGGRSISSLPPTTTPTIEQDIAHRNVFANNSYATPTGVTSSQWVKMFVPWALGGDVGEWNFYRNALDTNRVRDDSLPGSTATDERASQAGDLRGNAFRYTSYVQGALETWTAGALSFDGANQYLTLPTMEPGEKSAGARRGLDTRIADLGTGSFMIEAYLRANPQHLGGAVVSKMRESGFELKVSDDGGLSLMLRSPYQISTVEQALVLKDGGWHHVLVEVDRVAGNATFYIDGRFISSGGPLLKDPLASRAELWVGRGSDNSYFAGEIDFLRICRGTLAEAGTSIEELYAWEFDGPQLRDFGGRKP